MRLEDGLHRISADVAVENKACIRVLEKLRMSREGVARDCIRAQGKWWTEAQYAILEHEHRGEIPVQRSRVIAGTGLNVRRKRQSL